MKKRIIGGIASLIVLIGIGGALGNKTQPTVNNTAVQAAASQSAKPATTPSTSPQPTQTTTTPSGNSTASSSTTSASTYTNVDGNQVESPDSNATGATALCRDGTYSHSQHRSGTCSGHGGVQEWL